MVFKLYLQGPIWNGNCVKIHGRVEMGDGDLLKVMEASMLTGSFWSACRASCLGIGSQRLGYFQKASPIESECLVGWPKRERSLQKQSVLWEGRNCQWSHRSRYNGRAVRWHWAMEKGRFPNLSISLCMGSRCLTCSSLLLSDLEESIRFLNFGAVMAYNCLLDSQPHPLNEDEMALHFWARLEVTIVTPPRELHGLSLPVVYFKGAATLDDGTPNSTPAEIVKIGGKVRLNPEGEVWWSATSFIGG